MRNVLRTLLTDHGFEVVGEAADGIEAVEQFKACSPDLVTMDIVMPRMDGINAVRQIMACNPRTKVVMCSSLGQQEMVIDAIRAGAKAFITKPFDPAVVLETLQKLAF
jgi:two-component system chemotaxis response regulator CheY